MKLSALRRCGQGVLAKANKRPESKLQPLAGDYYYFFNHTFVQSNAMAG